MDSGNLRELRDILEREALGGGEGAHPQPPLPDEEKFAPFVAWFERPIDGRPSIPRRLSRERAAEMSVQPTRLRQH